MSFCQLLLRRKLQISLHVGKILPSQFFQRCITSKVSNESNINQVPILERLDAGETIIGDGGMIYCLEHRGYVTATNWTPEAVVEYPDAVRELHREFALCGADILQACIFNGTNDTLNAHRNDEDKLDSDEVNEAGCRLVTEVAKEFGCYVGFPVSTTSAYSSGSGKEYAQKEFRRQIDAFGSYKCDLMIAEYIATVEEAEWAIEVMKEKGLPIAVTLSISTLGDMNGVSPEECGVRLAEAGVNIIGTNCRFSPTDSLDAAIRMKNGVEQAGYSSLHFMCQPNAWRMDAVDVLGLSELPECPYALEPRLITRFEAQKFSRRAYDAGFRYIGGCCGFQPYHIRALAEELHEERGKLPINSRGVNASALNYHTLESMRKKANKEFWYNLQPVTK